MKSIKYPDRVATVASTNGFKPGALVTVGGVWYLIRSIIDETHMTLKQVRPSKAARLNGANR